MQRAMLRDRWLVGPQVNGMQRPVLAGPEQRAAIPGKGDSVENAGDFVTRQQFHGLGIEGGFHGIHRRISRMMRASSFAKGTGRKPA